MLASSEPTLPQRKEPMKMARLFSFFALAAVLVYVLWIFFARWQENRAIENRAVQQKAEKQKETDRAIVEQLGGKDLAIQMFYAAPGSIRRGESLQLCYGVANAKNIKLEPQAGAVWPSHNRCLDVSPTQNITYTLTIDDGAGNSKSQSLDVKVR